MAVIKCEPALGIDVVRVAVVIPPVVLTLCAAPRLPAPSLNCTVAVGAPDPGAVTVTVAVNVTGCPTNDGFNEEVTAVDVDALATVCATVLLLILKFASPR